MQSTASINSTDAGFFRRESNGSIKKTQKLLEWEQNRVAKVREARDRAVVIAMEKTAKQILVEKKKDVNEKRYHDMLKDEAMIREARFE